MSTIHTMQVTDYSPYLQQLSEAKKKKSAAALRSAYEKNLAAIEAEGQGLDQAYRRARNATVGVSRQEGRNFAQYAAANGLNNGAAGQAQLARSITLQNNLNDLNVHQADRRTALDLQRAQASVDYESGLAAAEAAAEAELAQALYKEKVRQQELDYDIRKFWYNNGIVPIVPSVGQGSGAGGVTGGTGAGGMNTSDAVYQAALQVIQGQWGNGEERRRRLTEAGYDYNAVQSLVDAMLSGT